MASIVANLPTPLLVHGGLPLLSTIRRSSVNGTPERHNRMALVVKATSKNSESSTSLSVVKSVQNVWENPEERVGLAGLGFAAIVAFWASTNLITAIDKLPLMPGLLELIGILFSSWFVYRYLLFKPDREELLQIINKTTSNILGQ